VPILPEDEVGIQGNKMDSEPERLGGSQLDRLSLSRIVRSPLTWLLVLMSVQWALLDGKGKFNPKLVNDTHTYVGVLQQDTFADILSASRTIGYPLFLKVVGPLAPGFGAVPEAHTIVYFATILIFWVGART
jgi:hypothetical protein